MKRGVWIALVVGICTPMMLSLALLLMVTWPKMDGLTQKMPQGLKATVAGAIVRVGKSSKASRERAELLDTHAAKEVEIAFLRSSVPLGNTGLGTTSSRIAEDRAGALQKDALELAKKGDYCGAEDAYTRAAGAVSSSNDYWYTEGMGRMGLACGDLPGARAGLETSLESAARYLKGIEDVAEAERDTNDIADTKADIVNMHEMLVVVYDRQKEKKLSAESCSAAHPEWKRCACTLNDTKVSCVEKK